MGNSSVVSGRIAGDFKLFHLTTATWGGLGYACCQRPNQLVSRNSSRGVLHGLMGRTHGARALLCGLLGCPSREPGFAVISTLGALLVLPPWGASSPMGMSVLVVEYDSAMAGRPACSASSAGCFDGNLMEIGRDGVIVEFSRDR